MKLYSKEELEELKEFVDLDEALKAPDQVVRFRADRLEDSARLTAVLEFQNLQMLSLSLSNVSQILPRLSELKNLQMISFQACKIAAFPEALFALAHLRDLALGNNSICEMPAEVGRMACLEALRLGQNKIVKIPDEIGSLARLKSLGLSSNRIEALPTSICDLECLRYLGLDSNRLQNLPTGIGRLVKLESLSLDFNCLTTLPESICRLSSLKRLSIQHNPLESLPVGLSSMSETQVALESTKRRLYMDWSYSPSEKPPQIELDQLGLFVAAQSPLHASLAIAVEKAGFSKYLPLVETVARDAVMIESTVPDHYEDMSCSRLGGFPDLPDPSFFPRTDDEYWCFLAQLNLAEIASLNSYLPRSGLLSFFIDSTESQEGKVLFFPEGADRFVTVRHEGAELMFDPDDDYTEKPHRVRFSRAYSLPHVPPSGISEKLDCDNYERCRELTGNADHGINCYTYTQHESPSEQAADKLKGLPEEWVPLLKLGWDVNVGFCFWDAGTLTFSIHREDLRREDFSKVHLSLESS